MTPETFTGWPESFVGENLAPRAAEAAAARSNGWPLTADAETTFPFSSISTWTLTDPPALTALAAGGYGGFGRLIALPFNTPPERSEEHTSELQSQSNLVCRLLL